MRYIWKVAGSSVLRVGMCVCACGYVEGRSGGE